MLATTVSPLVTGAATYSDELQGAYDYAYSKGITTMTSIDNANMYGELTRGQLAKMISQWAEKELWVTADETAACSFTDANTAEGDLATYVVKACQMGLMGQGITAFRPNDKVTRGEFGTTLSRAIWGDKYNQENPFYEKHLQALKDAWIMTKIEDPNQMEIRGWVMLMLERASESGVISDSECNDPAVLLACALGSDGCPAKCQKDNASDEPTADGSTIDGLPIAGDLSIAVADYTTTVKSAPAVGTVIFNAVDFKASEKVTIESVKVERTGLSDKSAIKGVWFEKDGVAVSAKASLTSDGTATTRFYNGYSVNGTDTLDFVVELSGAAGSEIAFKLVDVTSTAKNSSFNTETTTYRTTTYNVAKVNFKYNTNSTTSYKVGEKTSYEIGRFQITNENSSSEDKDVVLKSLKLKNNEGLDLASTFKNVYVTRDSKTVSKRVELDGKTMIIYFDNDELASGKKGIYTIFAEVASLDDPGKSVQLYLNKDSELVANEISSNFRVSYHSDMKTESNLMLGKYIFNGGKVTFTTSSSFPKTVEAAPSSTDVEIANGTLTVAEPIKLEWLSIVGTLTVANRNPVKALKVEIWGSTYTASDVELSDNNKTATWKFTDEMYISKSADVKVLVNVATNASNEFTSADSVTFTNLNGYSFTKLTYENSDKTYSISDSNNSSSAEIAGTVQIAKLIPTAGKFFITNKATSTQRVVLGNSDEVTIFDGEISTSKDRVTVNDLIVSGVYKANVYSSWTADSNTGNYATSEECESYNSWCTKSSIDGLQAWEQISLTVYINWEPYSDAIFKSADVTFSNLGDVSSGNAMKVKITAQPSISKYTWSITFKVKAEGSDSQGNEAKATQVSAVALEITEKASLSIANSAASSTVEKAGSNAELVKFSTTVKNWSLDFSEMVVKFTWALASDASVYAEFDGKRVDGSVTLGNPSSITFENFNETLEVWKHEIVVKSDINADDGAVALQIFNVAINKGAPTTLNVSKLFGKAYPVLSLIKSDTNNNEITIKIANPSDSDEDIRIDGFAFNNSGYVNTISLNDQSISEGWLANGTWLSVPEWKRVTLAAGESTEFRFQAASSWDQAYTAELKWITVHVDNKDYVISDSYTNVAKWADLKITYKK